MAKPDKQVDVQQAQQEKDIQQDSRVTDKNSKDRPGIRAGQPPTNNDYDYRPDFGTSGGGVEFEQHIDGQSEDPKKRPPEGDKPDKCNQREEKWTDKNKN